MELTYYSEITGKSDDKKQLNVIKQMSAGSTILYTSPSQSKVEASFYPSPSGLRMLDYFDQDHSYFPSTALIYSSYFDSFISHIESAFENDESSYFFYKSDNKFGILSESNSGEVQIKIELGNLQIFGTLAIELSPQHHASYHSNMITHRIQDSLFHYLMMECITLLELNSHDEYNKVFEIFELVFSDRSKRNDQFEDSRITEIASRTRRKQIEQRLIHSDLDNSETRNILRDRYEYLKDAVVAVETIM